MGTPSGPTCCTAPGLHSKMKDKDTGEGCRNIRDSDCKDEILRLWKLIEHEGANILRCEKRMYVLHIPNMSLAER